MTSAEFFFRIPGLDDFFSLPNQLADYDRLLAEAFQESDRRITAGVIEVIQMEHHGLKRDPVGISLGSMEVSTVALKFGIDMGKR